MMRVGVRVCCCDGGGGGGDGSRYLAQERF